MKKIFFLIQILFLTVSSNGQNKSSLLDVRSAFPPYENSETRNVQLINKTKSTLKENKKNKSSSISFNTSDIIIFEPNTTCNNEGLSEPSIFIDPNQNFIFSSSIYANKAPCFNGFDVGGFISTDGGLTWNGSPTISGLVGLADPTCSIDLNGNLYVCYSTGTSTGVLNSNDLGVTWVDNAISLPTGQSDKNHFSIDNSLSSPFVNNAYCAWVDFSVNDGEILFSKSNTSNISLWSTPQNISPSIALGGGWNAGANIQTSSNGNIYVTWVIYDSPKTTNQCTFPTESGIGFARSTDGGNTWTTSRIPIAIKGIRGTGSNFKDPCHDWHSFPTMAVNQQNGSIYIAWANQGEPLPLGTNTGDSDIYLIKSIDGGNTWSTSPSNPPIKVNTDNTNTDQWKPWMSCDPITGAIALIFYDARNYSANYPSDVYVAISADDGIVWNDFMINDEPYFGSVGVSANDYIGIAINNNLVYPVWSSLEPVNGKSVIYTQPFSLECEPDLSICNAVEISTITYKASNNIDIAGPSCSYLVSNSAEVSVHAGNKVGLHPGFHAEPGSFFHAYILDNCNVYGRSHIDDNLSLILDNAEKRKTKSIKKEISKSYPNPFSDNTTIEYELDNSSYVQLEIYDVYGNLIKKITNRAKQEIGIYYIELNAIEMKLTPGIYYYVLTTNNQSEVKPLSIMK